MLMALAMKLGHSVEFFDEDLHAKDRNLERVVKDFTPDLIAVTTMTPQYFEASRKIKQFRALLPNAPIVLGGIHATALPQQTMSEMEEVDFLCVGEGEKTFSELLAYLEDKTPERLSSINGLVYRSGEKVLMNAPRELMPEEELESLPQVAWDKLTEYGVYRQPLHYESSINTVFSIITARGCPFECTFCDEGTIWKRKVRKRSIDNVVSEIRYLQERFDAKYFNILDDTFTLLPARVEEFCNRVAGLNINFRITAKVNTVSPEMLAMLKTAGCRLIAYGVESGDQEVLNLMKKKQTIDEVKRAFSLTNEAGIMSYALCMVGNLGENLSSVEKTADLVEDIKADLYSVAAMTPYPGSTNYKVCKENGWIIHEDWEKWCPTPVGIRNWEPVARTDLMDKDDVTKAYYMLNRRFVFTKFKKKYGRIYYLNPAFFRNEILARLRAIGFGSVLRTIFRIARA